MPQGPETPEIDVDGGPKAALSGDVRVDDGDRVYVAEGDLVAGKYSVERVLGVGGVGFVVAARHADLGGHFALKFLKKRFLHDKAIVERFTREAKAVCRIKSEHVARVFDVGTHGHAPFIVMEHLSGRDLAAVLVERGAFAVGEAVEYTIQACAALTVAHASGIVHRDIKPENLFLVDEEGLPTIKLLDFGISKVVLAAERPTDTWGPIGEPITGTRTYGTPLYMSPEQIRSTATVDARSDVWSLGMVLYELLTTTTAFRGESVADVCSAILDQQPPWLSDLAPEVPPGLADVVARCIQKDPANRFPNIADLAVALLPFAPPRALAIAEGSSAIRRAALHTLRTAPVETQRVSDPSGERITVSDAPRSRSAAPALASTSPTPLGSTPSQAVTPWSLRRRIVLVAGFAVVVGLISALGAARVLKSHGDEPSRTPGAVPTRPPPVLVEPAPAPVSKPAPASSPRVSDWRPALQTPPAESVESGPAAPGHAWAPFHPARAIPVHAQPSAKPGPSSSAPTESSAVASPSVAPPTHPSRPDVGY